MTAEQKYEAFESLRNRFGANGIENSKEEAAQLQQLSKSGSPAKMKRRSSGRPDPRCNAPPLVPLVEEGDKLQEVRKVARGGWGWGCRLQPADKEGRGCFLHCNLIFLIL